MKDEGKVGTDVKYEIVKAIDTLHLFCGKFQLGVR